MINKELKEKYSEIFSSHGDSLLQAHIQKIAELDEFLPVNSTFYCITNTQTLKFEYISKNMFSCLGLDMGIMKTQGMRYFWSRMHPDDVEHWLQALKQSHRRPSVRLKMCRSWCLYSCNLDSLSADSDNH